MRGRQIPVAVPQRIRIITVFRPGRRCGLMQIRNHNRYGLKQIRIETDIAGNRHNIKGKGQNTCPVFDRVTIF